MSEQPNPISRRSLFVAGAALAAGAAAAYADVAHASSQGLPLVLPAPAALGPVNAALTYIGLEEPNFWPDFLYGTTLDNVKYVQQVNGAGLNGAAQLSAVLPIPSGSVIKQINVAYTQQPIINVYERPLATPKVMKQYISQSLPAGNGDKTVTFDLDGSVDALKPINVVPGNTYSLRFYLSPGNTIFSATVGYLPPVSGFVPYTGANQRLVDTRNAGGKFSSGEERTYDLGGTGARFAVFNLAVADTESSGAGNPGGFLGAFKAGITWPGNASINWAGAGNLLSNTVICPVSADGKVSFHCGGNKTHAIVDMIGYIF